MALPLILFLLSIIGVNAPAQTGTPPKEQPAPAPQSQPSGSGKTSTGGVSTGVSVDVGSVLHQVFKRRWHVKVAALPEKVQAGQPVTLNASVNPAASQLSYVFQWSKDSPGEQKDTATAAHTYDTPGQYKARVTVYEKGKKVASSDEVTIVVQPATQTMVAANPSAPLPEVKPAAPATETKPPAVEPAITPQPAEAAPSHTEEPAHAPDVPSEQKPQPQIVKEASAPASVAIAQDKKASPTAMAVGPVSHVTPSDREVKSAVVTPLPEYSASLHVIQRAEAGKQVTLQAQLTPDVPAGKQLKYCFLWGDGEARTCQNSPSVTHIYRAANTYYASVEVFADQQRLAAGSPVLVNVVSPLWGVWPFAVILLVILAAGYGVHRLRKAARVGVIAKIDAGRHTVNTDTSIAGEALHIRCVHSKIVSTVTFSPVEEPIEGKKETAHA